MKIDDVINQAKNLGVCNEWFQHMKQSPNIMTLCQMFFNGEDWALENNFPTPEILRCFPEAKQHGLLVDVEYRGEAPQRIAFFGESVAELTAGGYNVSEIILRQNSKLKIKATGFAKVFITALDNSQIEAKAIDSARIVVLNKRKKAKDTLTGNTKVI